MLYRKHRFNRFLVRKAYPTLLLIYPPILQGGYYREVLLGIPSSGRGVFEGEGAGGAGGGAGGGGKGESVGNGVVKGDFYPDIEAAADEGKSQFFAGGSGNLNAYSTIDAFAGFVDQIGVLKLLFEGAAVVLEAIGLSLIFLGIEAQFTFIGLATITMQTAEGLFMGLVGGEAGRRAGARVMTRGTADVGHKGVNFAVFEFSDTTVEGYFRAGDFVAVKVLIYREGGGFAVSEGFNGQAGRSQGGAGDEDTANISGAGFMVGNEAVRADGHTKMFVGLGLELPDGQEDRVKIVP